jgi:hypothetical protein
MIIIYVGDVNEYLGDLAKQQNPTAQLITNTNYSNLNSGTYYVSIGDLDTLARFAEVLRQATHIVYAPPAKWSDQHKNHSKMQEWTESYLVAFADKKPIEGFNFPFPADKDTMLRLVDTRKTDGRQLWIVGCSFTFGVGVTTTQRYGQLLSDCLGLPVSFLAWPGSSLTWAADQILRSDILAGDIVIWGLTAQERFPYFKNNVLTHVNTRSYETNPELKYLVDISFLDSQQLIYQAVVEIHQVINFCKKVGAQLILAQLLGRGLEIYLHGYENYQMLAHQYGRNIDDIQFDTGSDKEQHPGPLMHQWYCEQILTKYYKVYGDKK